MFLNCFNVLILKIIFLNVILIHFWIKNTLKLNFYHIFKQTFIIKIIVFN